MAEVEVSVVVVVTVVVMLVVPEVEVVVRGDDKMSVSLVVPLVVDVSAVE